MAALTDSMITNPVYEVGVDGLLGWSKLMMARAGQIDGGDDPDDQGRIDKAGSNVLYLHLGGQPGLNAYSSYCPH